MKRLGDRNFTLISRGAKTLGTLDPKEIFCCFEEDLYIDEIQEIYDFLAWCHETGHTIGWGNYEEVFQKFKRENK
jgi:hypothetical protein